MDNWRFIVDEEGRLIGDLLLERQAIYTGRNGKQVERIAVAGNKGETLRLIFKPLTCADTKGREAWFSAHVLPLLPMIRYPRLLGAADHDDPERYWLIFEDLGELDHSYIEATLTRAASVMPYWHLLPLETVPELFEGHTPPVEQVWPIVAGEREELVRFLSRLGAGGELIGALSAFIRERSAIPWDSELVVSHGDLYPLNVVLRDDELIVLDWEYIHRGSVYWDLYNLLDITSPTYRRPPVDCETRLSVLKTYAGQRERMGKPVRPDFIPQYHAYSAAYSAWILLLIGRDLAAGRHNPQELCRQGAETLRILEQMLHYLST